MAEGHRARIKRRYAETGVKGMPPHNVLELLLTYAIPRRDLVPLSHSLIERFGSVSAVLEADESELLEIEGLGDGSVAFLKTCNDLCRRIITQSVCPMPSEAVLDSVLSGVEYVFGFYESDPTEGLSLILLDGGDRVIRSCRVCSNDSIRSSQLCRRIFELAVQHNALSLILLRSDQISATSLICTDDEMLYEQLGYQLQMLGIRVCDYIVINPRFAYSCFNLSVYINSSSGLIMMTPQEFATLQVCNDAGQNYKL